MDCTITASVNKSNSPSMNISSGNSSPSKSSLHVNFEPETEEAQDRKKKYLTAKYGQHQMGLIKKRLRVEMWMYDRLQVLYGCTNDSSNYEVEIDLDELLDIEEEIARKSWLKNKLIGVKKSESIVDVFINELLEKAKTL